MAKINTRSSVGKFDTVMTARDALEAAAAALLSGLHCRTRIKIIQIKYNNIIPVLQKTQCISHYKHQLFNAV